MPSVWAVVPRSFAKASPVAFALAENQGYTLRMDNHAIVLFDGVCNTCNWIVDSLLRHDKKDVFRFASLQSRAAKEILKGHQIPEHQLDTLVVVHNNQVYLFSHAALKIAELLGPPMSLIALLRFLPRFLTDFGYRLFAKNRYRLFGKSDTCRLPTPQERAKFIGDGH